MWSATIYEYLQYTISDNIWLTAVYDQRQYMIICSIRSAPIYDYLQYTISVNIWISAVYEQSQHTIIYCMWSATKYDQWQYTDSENIRLSTIYDQRQHTIIYSMRSATIYDYIKINPVSEGYLRKISVERRGKYPDGEGHLTVLETGIFANNPH
jgi:hypothetical protein